MPSVAFSDFVKMRELTNDDPGDFARHARHDHCMVGIRTWDQLETYIVTESAIPEALLAAKAVWSEYSR